VTGLTSNPTIFHQAVKSSTAYDATIREKFDEGHFGEVLFFDLALEDLTRAADLFRPICERTNGVDGWVSLEVSPLLAHDTDKTLALLRPRHAVRSPLVGATPAARRAGRYVAARALRYE
jgi:transaldolase